MKETKKEEYLNFHLKRPERGHPYVVKSTYSKEEKIVLKKLDENGQAGTAQRKIVISYMKAKKLLKPETDFSFDESH